MGPEFESPLAHLIKMVSEQIVISLPNAIIKKLEKEKEIFSYNSIQEIITEVLRDKYLRRNSRGGKRGRPKKVDSKKVLSRKKIFHKKGIPIDV
jgi:hypothetical protein